MAVEELQLAVIVRRHEHCQIHCREKQARQLP